MEQPVHGVNLTQACKEGSSCDLDNQSYTHKKITLMKGMFQNRRGFRVLLNADVSVCRFRSISWIQEITLYVGRGFNII
jgi:hypothetical protein